MWTNGVDQVVEELEADVPGEVLFSLVDVMLLVVLYNQGQSHTKCNMG